MEVRATLYTILWLNQADSPVAPAKGRTSSVTFASHAGMLGLLIGTAYGRTHVNGRKGSTRRLGGVALLYLNYVPREP